MLDVGEELGQLHHEDYSSGDYEAATKVEQPVMIAKVDCVDHPSVCNQEGIRAYPTLKLFHDEQLWAVYNGHRTLLDMVEWLYFEEEKIVKKFGGTKDNQILHHVHKGEGF